ncbi:FAD-dependent monooxygenase [Mycobacterium sp. NAZ190054]|uniref:FAD-dependent monooxygenase n=1 Tax=Mycobacterium sp. NAZ190054 TaxID=1747766 RepID=UPI0007975CAC|nr:FAD-dependent monooxygenase [Mycobacterium sp. NAZ190054]KWX68417.1 hypothetical protein ASJ79_03295 [Mycobacterium sp. NAZ190054]
MQLRNQTVLISGGGIAGPALAYWLHRYGFTPIIVERAPSIRTGGQRIEMSGVGVEALHRMSLLDRARAVGGPPPNPTFYLGRRNRPVSMVTGGSTTDPQRAGFAVKRGALCELLYEHVRDDVEYVFDESVTGITATGDGVEVTFENSPPRHVDLVIGADGLHSNVRSLVMGSRDDHSHYLGTNLVIFTVDNFLGLRDTMTWHVWPKRGCAITTFPGNAELEGLFLIRSTEPLPVRGMTRDDRVALVEEVFAGDGWHVPQLLRAMRDARDFHIAPSMQIRMDAWTSGRVALVGDAGYCPDPMTGQGTGLALIGAYTLAGELNAAKGDHTIAFPAYETATRRFVRNSQSVGKYSTAFAAPSGGKVRVWLQEQGTRAFFSLLGVGERLGVPLPAWETDKKLALAAY